MHGTRSRRSRPTASSLRPAGDRDRIHHRPARGSRGIDAAGIHGVQTLGDGIALRDDLERLDAAKSRAVVVGAGYVGLELAEALHRRGLHVTVVEAGKQPMDTLDPDMGALVAAAIRGLGIDLRTDTKVERVRDRRRRDESPAVVVGDSRLPADIVVLGLGVEPNVALARDAGIEIGPTGGIATDARMATSVDGVWAAGDCVAVPSPRQRPAGHDRARHSRQQAGHRRRR